jgi:hypothetical protein
MRLLRRPYHSTVPGRRSVKIRREQRSSTQKNLRVLSSMDAGSPAQGRSAILRWYRLCTRDEC